MKGRRLQIKKCNISDKTFHTLLQYHKVKPKLTLSEWSDKNRFMTTGTSSRVGRWKTSFTPYLKQIMDDLSPTSPVREVYVMKSAQIGLTEIGINWLMYIIEQEPAKTWYALPTDANIKTASKLRFETALKHHPEVHSKILDVGNSKDNDQIRLKKFEGGSLQFVSCQVAKSLKSESVKNIFIDEVDETPKDIEGQGSAIEMLRHRQVSFSNSKFFAVSTPTIKGNSLIEDYFESSDMRLYKMPCPVCSYLHNWDMSTFNPKELTMKCPKCKNSYTEENKFEMLALGEWVPIKEVNKEGPEIETVVGYSLNSFYSPIGFVSWKDIAIQFYAVGENESKKKAFYNQTLGKTYAISTKRLQEENLMTNLESYIPQKVLPEGVELITAGADVQGDRIECEVVGWGYNRESWSLDYRVFYGDTQNETMDVYTQFGKYLTETLYKAKNGKNAGIRAVGIDARFQKDAVINFVNKHKNGVHALFGQSNTYMRKASRWSKTARVQRTYTIEVDGYKEMLFRQLSKKEPGTEYCHFSKNHNDKKYFSMLTAEERMKTEDKQGFKFEKVRKRNEALDCRIYAMAIAEITGIWKVLTRYTQITHRK